LVTTARSVSHRVAVTYLGKIVETDPAKDIAEKRHHPYTRALFAAVPSLSASDVPRAPRRLLSGEPPSAMSPPEGCAFHPRCPRAERGRCDIEAPPLQELVQGSRHRVACWHPETE
jgi:oligopeptide/dipeptide ABC transporter ATP-binding protein